MSTMTAPEKEPEAPAQIAEKPEWEKRWRYENVITATLEGNFVPKTIEQARKLVEKRFGCVYHKLPLEFQRDTNLLMEAMMQSSGHELGRAQEEVKENLTPEFFIEAIRQGIAGWILKYAPSNMQDNDEVVTACVSNDGTALQHASPKHRKSRLMQRIAIAQNPESIKHADSPSRRTQAFAERIINNYR
ncbi:DUF4116 domain-containing protein [Patescibacteria group bacterium]|nr:DUF4116 domain-containing protein [Patescibacteria group bacterium]